MRKLLIVLLTVFVITVTGCHSTNPPQTDADTQLETISETNIQNTETEPVESDISSDPSEDSISDIPGDASVFTSSPEPRQTSTAESQSNINQSQPVVVPDPLKPLSTPESKPQETTPPVEPVQPKKPSTQPDTNSSSSAESGTQKTEPYTTDSPQTSTPPEKDMKAEYQRIISEVTVYAQSYSSKGFTFVWDDSLVFGWETGYMGTPRVKYEGVDGVISILKYHVDKIVNTVTDPSNGIPAVSANYKVMQVTVDGDIAFVVLYG